MKESNTVAGPTNNGSHDTGNCDTNRPGASNNVQSANSDNSITINVHNNNNNNNNNINNNHHPDLHPQISSSLAQNNVPSTSEIKEKKRKKKKKRPPHKSKMITGYIIYASEIRKDVIKKYPDRDFGFISKLVGVEWKNLPQESKVEYEKRAHEQNAKFKAIAAEAFELKRLADAAEERAKEHESAKQRNASHQLPNSCNGHVMNGHNDTQQQDLSQSSDTLMSPNHIGGDDSMSSYQQNQSEQGSFMNSSMQQQPLRIIQQQHQTSATTVQYCSNNATRTPGSQPSQTSQTPQQKNNVIYRKPITVRLRPKDATTQTEPIVWVKSEPKKPLRYSQKFIDYLRSNRTSNNSSGNCS